jgi:hypothetical protein
MEAIDLGLTWPKPNNNKNNTKENHLQKKFKKGTEEEEKYKGFFPRPGGYFLAPGKEEYTLAGNRKAPHLFVL